MGNVGVGTQFLLREIRTIRIDWSASAYVETMGVNGNSAMLLLRSLVFLYRGLLFGANTPDGGGTAGPTNSVYPATPDGRIIGADNRRIRSSLCLS
jgi:hypothetical protein